MGLQVLIKRHPPTPNLLCLVLYSLVTAAGLVMDDILSSAKPANVGNRSICLPVPRHVKWASEDGVCLLSAPYPLLD